MIDTTEYHLPKSQCSCGHTGDGENSQHADTVQIGHGKCMVRDCECKKFSWFGFLPHFSKWKKKHKTI